jgi:hypothetical protein
MSLAEQELHNRQMRVAWHHDGMHRLERCRGCPYCFPDGPNGDYMTPPATYGEIIRRSEERHEYEPLAERW